MYRTVILTLAAVFAAACSGGIGSYEDGINAQAEVMNEMVSVLEGVTDEKSASKAAAEIETLGKRLLEIGTEMRELPKPSMEEMQEISEKRMKQGRELQMKAAQQMEKIAQYPALAEAWGRAMSNMK